MSKQKKQQVAYDLADIYARLIAPPQPKKKMTVFYILSRDKINAVTGGKK
ncbi:MAG: hypothetical protein RSC44_04440 [Clostridia bacterium]